MADTCRHGHPWTEETIYIDPRGARQCRACRNAWSRKNKDLPSHKAAKKKYQEEHPERQRESRRAWREKNREKVLAHTETWRAIDAGELIRQTECSRCGAPDPHAHHEDYSKPLEVVWLCSSCHRIRHKELDASDG